MDKGTKDKLAWRERTRIFTQEMAGSRRRGRPRKGWKEEEEERSSRAGSEKMERVSDR
jgi:hypothetical protein